MGQLSPLLSTLPAVQAVTATGRGHHAAHIGRRETIVAHAEALVHASQMHCAHEACMAPMVAQWLPRPRTSSMGCCAQTGGNQGVHASYDMCG